MSHNRALDLAVSAANDAADGDSNDDHIAALSEALHQALDILWLRRRQELRMIHCRHCQRAIINDPVDGWVDPEASGDDIIWRETCDEHDTFEARHEPEES